MPQRAIKQVQPAGGPEKAFGQALREIREKTGLSQEQLALRSDFDRTYISLIERGIRSPTIRAVVRLAATLDVTPSRLVSRMERILVNFQKQKSRHPSN